MGVAHEDLAHEVLVAGRHAGAALAAAPLRPVGRERHPLDVALVGQGHDHLFALDQRLDVGLELERLDRGAPRVGVLVLDLLELG